MEVSWVKAVRQENEGLSWSRRHRMSGGGDSLGSWYGYQRLLLIDPEMQAGGRDLSFLPNEYIDRFVMRCWLRSSPQKQAADLPWTVQLKDTILYLTLMGPFDCREFPSTYSQILKVARKKEAEVFE